MKDGHFLKNRLGRIVKTVKKTGEEMIQINRRWLRLETPEYGQGV